MSDNPGPQYKYRTILGKGGNPYQVRTRIPHCHPEERHKAHGLCAKCVDEKRSVWRSRVRRAARIRIKALPPVEGPKSTCRTCGREYVPMVQAGVELPAYARFCSSRCQSVFDALQPGDGWRSAFPGAQYQLSRDVPEQCPRCSGTLFETETGAGCLSCGRDFAVAERLVRAILLGYDDAYAMTRHETQLEVIKF